MVESDLNKIFLSASIPVKERDPKFFDTADISAIRDAVKALATVVIPKAHLIWGGHPAITPMIRIVVEKMNVDLKNHVTLYQSEFFRAYFPEDNFSFENIYLTSKMDDRDASLELMREQMIVQNDFKAGIFIGGMEGVIDEYRLFKKTHPNAQIIAVSNTGAAAKIIAEKFEEQSVEQDENTYAFMAFFQKKLANILKD